MWIEIGTFGLFGERQWVTSFAEVWIEILDMVPRYTSIVVTSFAEVWIEIVIVIEAGDREHVTSFAEVWIEIVKGAAKANEVRHFLRGSVD